MRLARSTKGAYAERFWEAPIFDAVRHVAVSLQGLTDFPDVAELSRRLFAASVGISLVEQVVLPKRTKKPKIHAELYDVAIRDRGEVPTRARCWHDLMNALVFAAYPAAKRALHTLHARELDRHFELHGGLPNARSRVQDVLALFDEGGVVLACERARLAECDDALDRGDAAAVARLVTSREARLLVFGHATLEHHVLDVALPRAASVAIPLAELDRNVSDLGPSLESALVAHVEALAARHGAGRSTEAPPRPALDLEAVYAALAAADAEGAKPTKA